jgi:hypothetical protein
MDMPGSRRSGYTVQTIGLKFARLVGEAGPLIALWPILIHAEFRLVLLVTSVYAAYYFAATKAHSCFRVARNVVLLTRLIRDHGTLHEFKASDYLIPLGIDRDIPIERQGRLVEPEYRILVIDGYNSYSTVQFGKLKSFILVPFEPLQSNSRRMFYLLHEMGHIGARNLVNSTAKVVSESAWGDYSWRYGWNGIKRLESVDWIFVSSCVFLFVDFNTTNIFHYEVNFMLWCAWILFTAGQRISGSRVEAEIEADHFALSGMLLINDPMLDEKSIFDDSYMIKLDNEIRKKTFRQMLKDAIQLRLANSEQYLWNSQIYPMEFRAYVFSILGFLALGYLGVFVGPLHVFPWVIYLYLLLVGMIAVFGFFYATMMLRRLDSTIAAARLS